MSFKSQVNFILEQKEGYRPIALPYKLDGLEPVISYETNNFHYNDHYKGYVKKLNKAMSSRKKPPLPELVTNIKQYNDKIKDNAGGAYNHQLFFNMMKTGGSQLTGELKEKINKRFGSFGNFKSKFVDNALDQFGSGWGWLVVKDDKLDIVRTANQDNPLMYNMGRPILGVDVWEHAYYLTYGPKRKEWLNKFFNIINWDFCSALLHTS